MRNQIMVLSLVAILLLNLAFVSADIIWSYPTTVHFSTGNTNGNNDDGENDDTFRNPQLIKDMEIENELYNIQYGEWTCINNRLQRTNIVQGMEEIEYGGLCGVSLNEGKQNNNSLFVMSLILIILIIISLILIILVFLKRR